MWPDLAKFCHFDIIRKACGICLKAYLALGNFEPTLTFFCNWAKFRCCKWPKIEEKYRHLVTLVPISLNRVVRRLSIWSQLKPDLFDKIFKANSIMLDMYKHV